MDRHDWDRRYATGQVWSTEPNRFVVAEVEAAKLSPGRALDLACGEGRNAVWLATLGWKVTAVDFSEVAIQRGRGWAVERGVEVDWVVDDVLNWSPAPGAYDLVIVVYLQLASDERRAVLAKASDALAPGGTVLVVAHHSDNLTQGWGGPQDPAFLSTESDVARDLPALDVVKAARVLRPVLDDEGNHAGDAIDLVVRAVRR